MNAKKRSSFDNALDVSQTEAEYRGRDKKGKSLFQLGGGLFTTEELVRARKRYDSQFLPQMMALILFLAVMTGILFYIEAKNTAYSVNAISPTLSPLPLWAWAGLGVIVLAAGLAFRLLSKDSRARRPGS